MAEKKITVSAVSEKQKKKRIEIQKAVYKLMDEIELTEDELAKGVKSYNRQEWERKFSQMSDNDFNKFMLKIKETRGYNFSFEANSLTSKNKMRINKIHQIAEKYGIPLTEYVIFPHKNKDNLDNPMVSKTPLPIIMVTVKRLQQMLAKKNKTTSDSNVVNPVTGQVTGDSKAARLSSPQTYSLITTGQENSVREYLSVRADDNHAKREMFKEIETTGKAHLSNYDISTVNKSSVQTMEVFLKSAGLRSNILKDTTAYNNKKSKEDLSNKDLKDINDFSMYKMLIFGEIHKDNNGIKKINKIIEKFHPNYILHEMIPPGTIISPLEAKEKLLNKDYLNHLQVEIQDILELSVKLQVPLVGIDADEFELKEAGKNIQNQFLIRENRMLKHIDQYFALPKMKIAVVIGDTHLRFFATKELGYQSPITKTYQYDNDTLIIRADEISREINNPKNYKIYFKDFIKNRYQDNTKATVYKAIIMLQEESNSFPIGKIKIQKNIEYLSDSNTISILMLEDSNVPATFITLELYDEYKGFNLEKYIFEIIQTIKEPLLNEYVYAIIDINSNLVQDFKIINDLGNYIEMPDNLTCLKIK